MRGAIAAGSEVTARAGAEILRAGGNAVDAAVAACFATAVGEPVLTSLAGAGVMLHRDAGRGEVEVCDFFANAPGLGAENADRLDFFDVELDFGPARQSFHIGAGSAAVPGAIPGLCTAHARWGRLSLAEVIEPACRFLRDGVPLEPWQAGTISLLAPILEQTDRGRLQFSLGGRLLQTGDIFRIPELAEFLEQLARDGWERTYDGVLGEAMLCQFGPQAGGRLTRQDLDSYRVELRQALKIPHSGGTVYTNPPPSAGGRMIALMLALLGRQQATRHDPKSPARIRDLCRAMRVADEARAAGDDALDSARVEMWEARFAQLADQPLGQSPPPPTALGSTTHISVIDADGSAVSVTFSYGEGNGTLVGNSGIMMNNLMGEEDLFPSGFHAWQPGTRLATMMAPTVMVSAAGDITVLGTGGANRIRTALLQVISYLQDYGYSVEHAVKAQRVHFEAGVLNAETFEMTDAGAALEQLGARELVRFDQPNLFFGGVHLVRLRCDGTLEGAGDPRRGGACLIV